MRLPTSVLKELQNRLKVGNRRGVHLNAAIPKKRTAYKLDLKRLDILRKGLAEEFLERLLTEEKLNFKISWNEELPAQSKQTEQQEHLANNLAKSFVSLGRNIEAIESDTGINNFAFGYPLLVIKSEKDGKPIVAPLFIWSLTLKKMKAYRTWSISRSDDHPVVVNEILANYLEADSGVYLKQEALREVKSGLITRPELADYVTTAAKQVFPTDDDDGDYDVMLSGPLDKVLDKDGYENLLKKKPEGEIINAGLFSLFSVQKQNLIKDYDALIESADEIELAEGSFDGSSYEDLTYVPTDPSQQDVLTGLREKANLIIQGPPGTGKSQTLAAILANGLYSGKRTLVVCEKRTALEVLEITLKKLGYGDLCTLILDSAKNRRPVVDSVRRRAEPGTLGYHRTVNNSARLEHSLSSYKTAMKKINGGHEKLDRKLPDGSTWGDAVGEFLKLCKQYNFEHGLELSGLPVEFSPGERHQVASALGNAEKYYYKYYREHKPPTYSEQRFLNYKTFYDLEDEISRDRKLYLELNGKLDVLEREALENLKKYKRKAINSVRGELLDLFSSIAALEIKNKQQEEFYLDKKTESWWYNLLAKFDSNKRELLDDKNTINACYLSVCKLMAAHFPADAPAVTSETAEMMDRCRELRGRLDAIVFKGVQKSAQDAEKVNLHAHKGVEVRSLISLCTNINERLKTEKWWSAQTNYAPRNLKAALVEWAEQLDADVESGYLEATYKWYNCKHNLGGIGRSLLPQLEKVTGWEDRFVAAYLDALLRAEYHELHPKNDEELLKLNEFEAIFQTDQKPIAIRNWANQQRVAIEVFKANNQDLGVSNLYMKRSSKNNKKKSLRDIIRADWNLFTSFFPIVLTVPDVASNLFREGKDKFDLVIFDEASQLRLEDTLPAILKGRQRIVAGDEHQMPPSSFFQQQMESDGEEETEEDEELDDEVVIKREDIVLDCESLLEFGEEMNFEKQFLDFHYRSRHPYLIEFSNQAFYSGRLIPQPNTENYRPISFVSVDGLYYNQQNKDEARKVVSIIKNKITQFPNGEWPSVGIATFNLKQRNLVLDIIDEAKEDDAEFAEKMDALDAHEDSFFVKNLENIQGDERDVIILSTTFGKNEKGVFAKRFGRINQKNGYKLLNVIVTRAKWKVYVCTSIPAKEYSNYKDALVTYKTDKRAAFFAYLAYARAVSEEDKAKREQVLKDVAEYSLNKEVSTSGLSGVLESVFEEEVYQLLVQRVEASYLTLQEKCGGFRIDMVYQKPGCQKIAIECDGAKYHSSRQAYLYDRARQRVLEGQGYIFHRIWSTLFWRNPVREVDKLVEFIESNGSSPTVVFGKELDQSNAFLPVGDAPVARQVPQPVVPSIVFEFPDEGEVSSLIIKVGSIVTLDYPQRGRQQKILLSDDKKLSMDGFLQVKSKSEVGAKLIGGQASDRIVLNSGEVVVVVSVE